MQQLWLAHQRIDSIAALRQVMEQEKSNGELFTSLCIRMMAYHNSGALKAWLLRQEEASDVLGAAELKNAIDFLVGKKKLGGTSKPSAFFSAGISQAKQMTLHEALAVLCGVDAKDFSAEEVTETLSAHEQVRREKLQQMKRQSWWSSYEDLFSAVKDDGWAYVVLNQGQLDRALELLRESHGTTQRILYLCNSDEMKGKWYALNLVNVEHVKIQGIADPKVQYARMSEGVTVNAAEKGIFFQDLVLHFHKRQCVVAYENNGVNYTQCMR